MLHFIVRGPPPKAYLHVLLFSDQFVFDKNNSIFWQMGATVLNVKQTITKIVSVLHSGYAYIYFSNESNTPVYFDNFMLTHVRSPLLQTDDYYPFGLAMSGISSQAAGKLENLHKYNKGSELQHKEFSDGSGLETYTTELRMLDPQLGRCWQLDSKPDYAISLYSSMDNNPISNGDYLGDSPGHGSLVNTVGSVAKGANSSLNQRYQVEPKRGATVTGIRDTQAGRISNKTGKPVGDWVVRVDDPHSGAPNPHINVNPKASGVPDPHTSIPEGAMKTLGKVGEGLEAINKVAKPVAIVTDAIQLGTAIQTDVEQKTGGDNTIVTTTKVASSWAGAIAFGTAGTETGAAIGTFILPGPGTAVGAFLGGSIWGAIWGNDAGKDLGNKIVDLKNGK